MGTHPIFESDFDCLTEKKMIRPIHALSRRITSSPANQLRQVKAAAERTSIFGLVTRKESVPSGSFGRTPVMSGAPVFVAAIRNFSNFNPLPTAGQSSFRKISSSIASLPRCSVMNLSLANYSVTFVCQCGDFALWAITNLATGLVEFVIDDNTGL